MPPLKFFSGGCGLSAKNVRHDFYAKAKFIIYLVLDFN